MNFEKLFIDGKWISSDSGNMIGIENPATLEIFAHVPRGNFNDVDKAVLAASIAFDSWSTTSIETRIDYMQKVLEFFKSQRELLIDLEVKELGAAIRWTEAIHIDGPLRRFANYIDIVNNFEFEIRTGVSKVVREPIGVVGCITPWNYPLNQVIQKIVPAILCGNTVVLKPSQMSPLTAFVLALSFEKAQVPKGVFNLVSGRAGEVGNALAKHEKVDMISFTGSTKGGREVGMLAIDGVKKIALELGGKSANILLKGADYLEGVKFGLSSSFDNTGQTCAALTRMIVPKEDLEEIEALIIEESKQYIVGDPMLSTTKVGPLASLKQFNKVKSYIIKGLDEGAKLIVGEVPGDVNGGYYVNPCVFTNVDNHMTIAQEEIFGPVMCLIAYETVEEAIKIANDSIYGLSGSVFGPHELANEVAKAMKTGNIFVNNGKRDITAPFGGYKQSGIGREGGYFGLEEFLEIKAIF